MLIGLAAIRGASAQEHEIRDEAQPTTRAERGPLQRSRYSGLFPFYTHEQYENGYEKTTFLFHALRFDRGPAPGDHYSRVFPLWARTVADGGAERALAIFPLLYWGKVAPDYSHDIVLPLFARWHLERARHVALWPLLQVATDPLEKPYRLVPTLFRYGSWTADGSREEKTSWRLGVPWLFDIVARSSRPDGGAFALATLFPVGEDAQSGLPLGRFASGADEWDAHLFPFFAAGSSKSADGELRSYAYTPLFGRWHDGWMLPPLLTRYESGLESHRLDVLWPLFLSRQRADGDRDLRVLPFWVSSERYGSVDGDERDEEGKRRVLVPNALSRRARWWSLLYGRVEYPAAHPENAWTDRYLPLALSHWGGSPGDPEKHVTNVLWPLFHSSKDGEESAFRLLPIYDESKDASSETMGIGSILYRRFRDLDEDSTDHWILFPLSRFATSPQRTIRWVFPVYLSYLKQTQLEREETVLVLPFYVSHWKDVQRSREDEFARVASDRHFWPFYGRSERFTDATSARQITHHTLLPFFHWKTATWESDPELHRHEIAAPWPLFFWERDPVSWKTTLFPLLSTGTSPDEDWFTLFPLLGVSGGNATPGVPQSLCVVQWAQEEQRQRFRLFPLLFSYDWHQDAERGDHTKLDGPLWLFRYRSDPDDGWFHLLPVGFAKWDEDGGRGGIFPFFYRRSYGERPIDYWTFARFFFVWNRLVGAGESHTSVLWKLVQHTSRDDGDFDFRILHRLFVHRRVEGQRELVVGPFFSSYSDERNDEESLRVLRFVYRSERSGGKTRRSVFFIPVGSSD